MQKDKTGSKDIYTGAGNSKGSLIEYFEKYIMNLRATREFSIDTQRSCDMALGYNGVRVAKPILTF